MDQPKGDGMVSLRKSGLVLVLLMTAGCSELGSGPFGFIPEPEPVAVDTYETDVAAPPAGATTVGEFDTTTAADRAEALDTDTGGSALGTVTATLGAPTDPGIWVKTALVSEVTQGRADYNGQSINVELRPLSGSAGAQISLPAMRLLNAPLTGIISLTLYQS